MLQDWAVQGRVRPDDYLVSIELDFCVQARDVAELDAIFRKNRARLLARVWRALACAAFVLSWVVPLFAAAFLAGAIAAAIVCFRTAHRSQAFSLQGADRSVRDRRTRDCALGLAPRSA
jgi:hypothetical protein